MLPLVIAIFVAGIIYSAAFGTDWYHPFSFLDMKRFLDSDAA